MVIQISGGYQPWKPSKTARRCLAACWGVHARTWIGRSVELYRDPKSFGGVKVGGIRVKAASGIDKRVTVMLASTRGKKAAHRIDVLKAEHPKNPRPEPDALQDDARRRTECRLPPGIRRGQPCAAGGTAMTDLVEFVWQKVGRSCRSGARRTPPWSPASSARVGLRPKI